MDVMRLVVRRFNWNWPQDVLLIIFTDGVALMSHAMHSNLGSNDTSISRQFTNSKEQIVFPPDLTDACHVTKDDGSSPLLSSAHASKKQSDSNSVVDNGAKNLA